MSANCASRPRRAPARGRRGGRWRTACGVSALEPAALGPPAGHDRRCRCRARRSARPGTTAPPASRLDLAPQPLGIGVGGGAERIARGIDRHEARRIVGIGEGRIDVGDDEHQPAQELARAPARSAAGTSESLPVMSASSSVIAALSLMTLPSGSTSVGTWASGLTFSSLARASGVLKRSLDRLEGEGQPVPGELRLDDRRAPAGAAPERVAAHRVPSYGFCSGWIRLDVSQRPPPRSCTRS